MADIYEYSTDEKNEWNLKDFFNLFKDKLPQLVIVTGGDYGPTQFDDLCNDQVVRYHQYYEQKRVIARSSLAKFTSRTKYLSIPVDSPYTFYVVKGPHQKELVRKPASMKEILKANKLPVMIEFASEPKESGIEKDMDGNKATYLIIGYNNENFLQGHCLSDDEMGKRPLVNRLSPLISVTPITGIKGQSKEEFKRFLKRLDKQARETKFCPQDCDLAIREYSDRDDDIRKFLEDNDLLPKVAPSTEPPPPIPKRKKQLEEEENDNTYEEIDKKFDLPKTLPKNTKPTMPSKQPPDPRLLAKGNDKDFTVGNKKDYVNDILCQVKPIQQPGTSAVPDPPAVSIQSNFDVTKLKIEDVGNVLSQLKLGKYQEKFKEDLIDGEYLKELDMTMLVEDFKFSRIEALRLLKYVEKGHLPS